MYSYDHRIRAIELYIKLGKLVSPTFRQFGCPTKNALKVWNREYQQHQALPAHYESRRLPRRLNS